MGALSSLLALLGVVSCCGMPILAAILAALGIGATQLSFFAQYRGWFIGFAIASLLFGFWRAYFRKRPACCTSSKTTFVQKAFLWMGTILLAWVIWQSYAAPVSLQPETPQVTTIQPSTCCPQ